MLVGELKNNAVRSDGSGVSDILRRSCFVCFLLAIFVFNVSSQRLAVIEPEPVEGNQYAKLLSEGLRSAGFRVVDDASALSAYRSAEIKTPFNLGSDEASQIGAAIGCDYFLLVRAETQRRSSFQKRSYYESTAAIFVVSSRSGQLIKWKLLTSQADTPKAALSDLTGALSNHIAELKPVISEAFNKELNNNAAPLSNLPKIEVLDGDMPVDKSFRSPIPYKRVKPIYTSQAYLFSITATVDVEVDIDEAGNVLRLAIIRWAGYGLDESVTDAIRTMNWRPAERNGKTLPMRVLLRYNFKKIEKDTEEDPQ